MAVYNSNIYVYIVLSDMLQPAHNRNVVAMKVYLKLVAEISVVVLATLVLLKVFLDGRLRSRKIVEREEPCTTR